MLCRACKKKEATVFLKLAVNSKVVEMHLCGDCAPYAADGSFGGLDIEPMNMAGQGGGACAFFKEFLPRDKRALSCPACGLAYHEFKDSGRLGCAGCYESFAPQLSELLTRIHGNCRHTGKRCGPTAGAPAPERTRGAARASSSVLRQALKKAVENEDFERAAELRDRIRKLEGHG
ncbi:MAG TPA: UvrB/UvrC motif-containing protein [Elusimicrobiales bacterium]|nr:UvrB/UvrC motif-containing protein [Elusimicrobiales bacterium]